MALRPAVPRFFGSGSMKMRKRSVFENKNAAVAGRDFRRPPRRALVEGIMTPAGRRRFTFDLKKSKEARTPILRLEGIEPI